MRHALVIGDNIEAASLIEARLWKSGYTSVAHAQSEAEAWDWIALRRPALIVVLADRRCSPPIKALSLLSRATDAPVLIAASRFDAAADCIGDGASLEGPYPLDGMDDAINDAAGPPLAACA